MESRGYFTYARHARIFKFSDIQYSKPIMLRSLPLFRHQWYHPTNWMALVDVESSLHSLDMTTPTPTAAALAQLSKRFVGGND